MSTRIYTDGILTEFWDDIARTYTDYRGGATASRAYTPEENARADAEALANTQTANDASLRVDVRAQIDALKALIGASTDPAGTNTLRAIRATPNPTINSGPAPYIQALAKALIDVVQAEVRISRVLVRAVDDTSTAPTIAP